jgi:hypothetical protein
MKSYAYFHSILASISLIYYIKNVDLNIFLSSKLNNPIDQTIKKFKLSFTDKLLMFFQSTPLRICFKKCRSYDL